MENPVMKRVVAFLLLALVFFVAYSLRKKKQPSPQFRPQAARLSLTEARRNFQTKLVRHEAQHEPVPPPPAQLFRTVHYESPAGPMPAYVSQPAKDGHRHPAIVWIFGGFGNDIGDTAWQDQPAENDQSASAFWKAGIVTMYPSFRGGNDNPGYNESFYGEVDDVLAAADYLAKQDFVDPNRIYLGGHSTGGTLALLVAESASPGRFRSIFSFGPADDVGGYGASYLNFDTTSDKEFDLRAPKLWLDSIHNPTLVFEGTRGNIEALMDMQRSSKNPVIHFYPLFGHTHFSTLAPMTRLLAAKILADNGAATGITLTDQELPGPGSR